MFWGATCASGYFTAQRERERPTEVERERERWIYWVYKGIGGAGRRRGFSHLRVPSPTHAGGCFSTLFIHRHKRELWISAQWRKYGEGMVKELHILFHPLFSLLLSLASISISLSTLYQAKRKTINNFLISNSYEPTEPGEGFDFEKKTIQYFTPIKVTKLLSALRLIQIWFIFWGEIDATLNLTAETIILMILMCIIFIVSFTWVSKEIFLKKKEWKKEHWFYFHLWTNLD